jgi:hypothetical protein
MYISSGICFLGARPGIFRFFSGKSGKSGYNLGAEFAILTTFCTPSQGAVHRRAENPDRIIHLLVSATHTFPGSVPRGLHFRGSWGSAEETRAPGSPLLHLFGGFRGKHPKSFALPHFLRNAPQTASVQGGSFPRKAPSSWPYAVECSTLHMPHSPAMP